MRQDEKQKLISIVNDLIEAAKNQGYFSDFTKEYQEKFDQVYAQFENFLDLVKE